MTRLTKTISVRLTEEEYELLLKDAARRKTHKSKRARELLVRGLAPDGTAEASPLASARLEALIRRATWAVIVSLSTDPTFDEIGTEAFLNAVLP